MQTQDILIAGGGAAGFFAALVAAEANPHLSITILEKTNHPLAKVRISGGGRCNLTHAQFVPSVLVGYYPRGSKELRGPLTRFGPRETMDWFERREVRLKVEPDGRVFPVSDRSQSIVDCLLAGAQQANVQLLIRNGVHSIRSTQPGFEVITSNGEALCARRVLLAVGGGSSRAYQLAASLGHTIVEPVPSLFTFSIADPRLEGLTGVSVPAAELTLDLPHAESPRRPTHLSAAGPLLITHWGLSGPAVLRLSAWGARPLAERSYRAGLRVNWLPGYTPETLFTLFQGLRREQPRALPANADPTRQLPGRLWKSLAGAAGIQAAHQWAGLSNQVLSDLAQVLTDCRFQIHGKGPFKEEFVTCGGVSLVEVDFRSMQSRLTPGLYFAGEYLDIDGLTGGFNFQAAWTTGWIAGKAMAS